MPYVPSQKTDGKSQDRIILDAAVELAAREAATKITNNYSLPKVYKETFMLIARCVSGLEKGTTDSVPEGGVMQYAFGLASAINQTGATYGYEGAFLGELNYAITRFIQRVPQLMVADGKWLAKDEIRYWLYAATIGALLATEEFARTIDENIAAVFHDTKDEYKWRVNRSYEAAQIVKSGDCYDTPFYSRLMEVVDEGGMHVGHVDVYLARSDETLRVDVLDGQLVFKNKK